MANTIKLDGQDYSTENITEEGQALFALLQYTNTRVKEIDNMSALLQRAKISYIDSLKKEILSNKTGLLLDDDN